MRADMRINPLSFVLVLALAGCDSQPTTTVGGGPTALLGADLAHQECAKCHDPGDGSYSGRTTAIQGKIYPKNLTPDETGVSGWTDAQFTGAIRNGVDDQGQSLCSIMPRFTTLSDEQVTSLIAFLRSLPPVKKDVPDSTCP
jgi:mono/diheme cytochrome c family protein